MLVVNIQSLSGDEAKHNRSRLYSKSEERLS